MEEAPPPQDRPSPAMPPAGWFPDVHDPDTLRWWDGSAWTPATRPSSVAEEVVAEARMDPFVAFGPGAALLLVAVASRLALTSTPEDSTGATFAALLTLIAIPLAVLITLRGFLAWRANRYTLTTKRLVFSTQFFFRRTHEILLIKIESLRVDQGLFGRLLGFGTVVVRGTGGGRLLVAGITDARSFLRKVQDQIESVSSLR